MMRNKKGVSPVIAVVLMIVVAVAISLVVYVWASGFVSEKTGAETKAGDYSFLVETKDVNSTNIRNTGTAISPMSSTDATNDFWNAFDLYVNNTLTDPSGATVTLHDTNSNNVWDKGEVVTINFNAIASAGDKIKLVHKDSGTPIVFKLE